MTTQKNEDRREIVRWIAQLGPVFLVLLAGWHAYHAAPGNNRFDVNQAFLAIFWALLAIFFLIALPENEDR